MHPTLVAMKIVLSTTFTPLVSIVLNSENRSLFEDMCAEAPKSYIMIWLDVLLSRVPVPCWLCLKRKCSLLELGLHGLPGPSLCSRSVSFQFLRASSVDMTFFTTVPTVNIWIHNISRVLSGSLLFRVVLLASFCQHHILSHLPLGSLKLELIEFL